MTIVSWFCWIATNSGVRPVCKKWFTIHTITYFSTELNIFQMTMQTRTSNVEGKLKEALSSHPVLPHVLHIPLKTLLSIASLHGTYSSPRLTPNNCIPGFTASIKTLTMEYYNYLIAHNKNTRSSGRQGLHVLPL